MEIHIISYLLFATHILMLTVLGEQKQEKVHVSTWILKNMTSKMPSNMVKAGKESNGDDVYVGRAYYNDYLLPAKVVPAVKRAYISLGGREVIVTQVELLVGKYYTWIPANLNFVSTSAVCVGKTSDNETLYMGRAKFLETITPGKIQVSHKALYIPYGGLEHRIEDNFEILVQLDTWVSVNDGQTVTEAIIGGRDVNGDTIYVARAFHEGGLIPGKGIPKRNGAYISIDGKEMKVSKYDVLVSTGYYWVRHSKGKVPNNAIIGGFTKNGELLYIGRAEFIGSITTGKIRQSDGCLYIPFRGKEIRLTEYEVLVRPPCN